MKKILYNDKHIRMLSFFPIILLSSYIFYIFSHSSLWILSNDISKGKNVSLYQLYIKKKCCKQLCIAIVPCNRVKHFVPSFCYLKQEKKVKEKMRQKEKLGKTSFLIKELICNKLLGLIFSYCMLFCLLICDFFLSIRDICNLG